MNPLRAAQRIYALRTSWFGEGGDPVPIPLARARAAICKSCPMNDERAWEGIATELIEWVLKIDKLKSRLAIPRDDDPELHVCKACDCVLKAKIWVPLPHVLKTTPLDKLDKNCWITAESQP